MKRWHQYGIAISVAWALGVTSVIRYQELPRAQEYAMQAYYICTEHKRSMGQSGIDACLQNVSVDWDQWMNRKWEKIATVALVPIAAGWLAAFVGMFVYRRIRPDRTK